MHIGHTAITYANGESSAMELVMMGNWIKIIPNSTVYVYHWSWMDLWWIAYYSTNSITAEDTERKSIMPDVIWQQTQS